MTASLKEYEFLDMMNGKTTIVTTLRMKSVSLTVLGHISFLTG